MFYKGYKICLLQSYKLFVLKVVETVLEINGLEQFPVPGYLRNNVTSIQAI